MPPIRTQKAHNAIIREGRIEAAIRAIQEDQIASIREAATHFDVPYSTLQSRLNGRVARVNLRANSHKLTVSEEEALVQWILDLDKRGLAPRPAFVENMANHLLSERGGEGTPLQVGQNWVYRLVQRRDELKVRFSRRYNYKRAESEDSQMIMEWFSGLQLQLESLGLATEDIYNFDETGFAMGLIATTRVITSREVHDQPKLLQLGNREWVTAIEAVNASGDLLPPYIIFKARELPDAWFDLLPLGSNWRLDKSDNGWTTDQIGLRWLNNHFIPETARRQRGKYRLLILDGHGSHLTPQFDELCTLHNIIPFCMPAHSSHLLQPLDVSVFGPLKREYGRLVEQRMRFGFNHITKFDFLEAFPLARAEAFKAQAIRNGFKATGICPFDPNEVLQRLHIQLNAPPSQPTLESPWSPKTPGNLTQLQRQATLVRSQISPSSRFSQAIDQIVKGCQVAMAQAAIMKKEYHDIFADLQEHGMI